MVKMKDALKVIPLLLMFVLVGLILVYIALQMYFWAAVTATSFLILLCLLACLSYISPDIFEWTGIAESTKVVSSKRRERTLWDWLGLWIIPFILSAGAIGFTAYQYQASADYNQKQDSIASAQQANDRTIAHIQEQQNIVQAYLDRMSDLLLLNPNIRNGQGGDVRILARARTLTVLQDLDPDQKDVIVHFLYYGDLIGLTSPQTPYQPIVNLDSANLFGVKLDHINLESANFQVADLSGASLMGANLSDAYLAKVDLSNAHLQQAYLCYASFIGAPTETSNLHLTNLSNAHLSGANLIGADLTRANLSGANLNSTDIDPSCPQGNPPLAANLTNANLKGARMSDANLTGVIWGNTICPDGRKSDDVGDSCINDLIVQ